MKKLFSFVFLLLLSGCAAPEGSSPPDQAEELPPDYIVSLQEGNGELVSGDENANAEDETTNPEDNSDTKNQDDIFTCREENAQLSLELDALKKNVADCQSELSKKPEDETAPAEISGLKASHLQLIRDSIINSEQKEFPFGTCGQMGTFLRSSWFDAFSRQLTQEKIRFANGFLETEDLFGGCQSTEGKMVFFLGAERGETISFILLKYDTANGTLEPALMLDNASSAVVTEFGKREGSFINFPSDDGRTFRYYYDANVVVEAP